MEGRGRVAGLELIAGFGRGQSTQERRSRFLTMPMTYGYILMVGGTSGTPAVGQVHADTTEESKRDGIASRTIVGIMVVQGMPAALCAKPQRAHPRHLSHLFPAAKHLRRNSPARSWLRRAMGPVYQIADRLAASRTRRSTHMIAHYRLYRNSNKINIIEGTTLE